MAQGNNDQGSHKDHGIDDLAIEAAVELSPEMLVRAAEITVTALTKEEQEQGIDNLVKEMNVRVNKLYQQKKQ